MFVELGAFYSEKEAYNKRVEEIKAKVTDPNLLARNLEEERLKFKGITRKYLAPALGVIKEMFGVDYSLYKVGRDVDVNFKTIETTIHKTQTEIAAEMNEFVGKANGMNLDEYKANRLNIAISVIMSYVDDVAVDEDENKAFYLKHSKVVASSLDLPVTKKEEQEVVPVQQEIQHNPYASQPVNLNNQTGVNQPTSPRPNEPLVDPFASIYGGTVAVAGAVSEPVPVSQPTVPIQPVPQTDVTSMQAFSPTYEPPGQDSLFQMTSMSSSLPQHNIQEPAIMPNVQPTIPQQSFFEQPVTQQQPQMYQQQMQPMASPQPVVQQTPIQPMMQQQVMQPQMEVNANQNQMMQQLLMPQSGVTTTNSFVSQPQPQPMNVQPTNQPVQQVSMPQMGVSAALMAAPTPQVVMPEDVTFETKNIVMGKEKTAVVAQIISTVLIPVLVAISSTILYFILNLDVVGEFTSKMPPTIVSMAMVIVIVTISLLLAGPIIWLAKKRTPYIERFLIAPSLLSFPVVYFAMELVSKMEIKDLEMAMHVVGILFITLMMYFIFVSLLFVRGFVNSANDTKVEAPKWNIFDKLGLILVIYTFVFQAIYEVCLFVGVDFEIINKVYEVMYFTNNETISQHLDKLFMIVGPIVAALGMIMRTIHIFKTSKHEAK